MVNSKNTGLWTLCVLFSLAVVGCGRDDGRSGTSAMVVDVAYPIVDSVVLHKSYPGYLGANTEVDLVARVNGYLLSHPYESGAFVKKGDVLFRIEDGQYQDAVKEAEARLRTARSNLTYAADRFEAMKKALASDAVSGMEYNDALNDKTSAEAAVAQAEAQLRTARTTLGYCVVRAPFDGHVSSSVYDVGTYLSGGGSPVKLATIYDDASLVANFNIEDRRYFDLARDNSRSLSLDLTKIPLVFEQPLPHKYTADLYYMSPAIDKSTGTMTIKAAVDNPYGELKTGMYVKVDLPYDVEPEALLIKDAAIGSDQLGKFIYVVNDSNKVVYTPIGVGEVVDDSLRIVTRGLKRGDKYVTKALLKVRDGQSVSPKLIDK